MVSGAGLTLDKKLFKQPNIFCTVENVEQRMGEITSEINKLKNVSRKELTGSWGRFPGHVIASFIISGLLKLPDLVEFETAEINVQNWKHNDQITKRKESIYV